MQHVRPGQTVAPTRVSMSEDGAGLTQVAESSAAGRRDANPARLGRFTLRLSMKLSQFFISRPIFAGVLSALIFLAGLIALPEPADQ